MHNAHRLRVATSKFPSFTLIDVEMNYVVLFYFENNDQSVEQLKKQSLRMARRASTAAVPLHSLPRCWWPRASSILLHGVSVTTPSCDNSCASIIHENARAATMDHLGNKLQWEPTSLRPDSWCSVEGNLNELGESTTCPHGSIHPHKSQARDTARCSYMRILASDIMDACTWFRGKRRVRSCCRCMYVSESTLG
jgi:hypothetical protein